MVFDKPKNKKEINTWLGKFQEKVDKITECNCLQFTAEVWGIKDDKSIINKKLKIVADKVFPYLDRDMLKLK